MRVCVYLYVSWVCMSVGTDLEIQLTKHQHHQGTWLFYTIHRIYTVTRRRRDSDNIRETFQRTQHACHTLRNTIVSSNKHHIQVHTWNCAAVQIFMDELCMRVVHLLHTHTHTLYTWMSECNGIHIKREREMDIKMEREYSQGSVSTFCHSPAKDYTWWICWYVYIYTHSIHPTRRIDREYMCFIMVYTCGRWHTV